MHNRMLTLLILGSLSLATAVQAGWKKLNGQKAPEVSANEWVNAGKKAPTAKDFRGKVILLEFFATW